VRSPQSNAVPWARIVSNERGSGEAEREVTLPAQGLVRLEQRVQVRGRKLGTDVSGPYWILGIIELCRGELRYLRGDAEIAPNAKRTAIFLPPWSVVQTRLRGVDYRSEALASRHALPAGGPREPILFTSPPFLPTSVDKVMRVLRDARGVQPIGRQDLANAFARRIKARIDGSYATQRKLSQLAEELRVAPAVLTRIFHRAYGMPPVRYRHYLRLVDGMLLLASGRLPAEVAAEVGFADLARFYSTFRALTCGSPAQYRTKVKKRQAI
jgi:AraC-like DNA-binding protein